MKLISNHIIRGCLFLMLVLVTGVLAAQTQVTGTITDAENGDPLIGASVLITGTSTGTVTDFDGNYSVNVPANAESLTISYTGYATQTIKIAGQSVINIKLGAGELLDEIVVVGYGTVTQKQVTSAVTTIDAEDFQAGDITDPAQLIQGKVAGLTVTRVGGNVNSGSTIRLRGLSSFGANASPLIIIDGVVGANLNTVDPADIESVNVLKDGSAAAIYGIQASAGVIIVTTKRGRDGKGQFAYRGYVSAENVDRAPQVAGREDYLNTIERAADRRREVFPDQPDLPTGADVRAANDYGTETDWIDELTRTGISHVHNLSYSGGQGGLSYRASVNYRDIKGVGVARDGFNQINGRLSVTQRAVNDRLSVSLDVTSTDRRADFFIQEAFQYGALYNPTAPARVDGDFQLADRFAEIERRSISNYGGYFEAINFDYFNPLAIAELTRSERQQNNTIYSLRTSFDVTDDFTLNLNYSRSRESGVSGYFASRESLFAGGASADEGSLKGTANRSTNDDRNNLFEMTGTYNLDLGGNDLELLAGYSWQEFDFQGFGGGGRGISSNAFGFDNLAGLTDLVEGTSQLFSYRNGYRVIGFFGRARMSIGSAYNVTASIRRDGTSRNGPENKWDIFPAISASADLVDALDITGPDQLKLRVGYGITGSLPNENTGYLQLFGNGAVAPFGGSFVSTITPLTNPNPLLRFEKKGEFNAGLDFAFMDYKLTGTLDFYTRTTRDLLFNAAVASPPFLFPTVPANLNNVDLINSGVELSLGYQFGNGENFSYEPRLIFSTFSTKLQENGNNADFPFGDGGSLTIFSSSPGAPGQNDDPITRVVIGENFGDLYARQLDLAASQASGEYVFINQNGDTDDNGNPIIDENDKVIVGNALPDFSLSLANTFRFGKVDASFFLRGVFGHDLANTPNDFLGQLGGAANRPIDNVILGDQFLDGIVSAQKFSDFFVEDASFVSLDNAQIGYTMDLGANTGFDNLRFYVAGQNLFMITGYSGVDPSVRWTDPSSALVAGIDRRNTYFRTRTFTAGVSVGF